MSYSYEICEVCIPSPQQAFIGIRDLQSRTGRNKLLHKDLLLIVI